MIDRLNSLLAMVAVDRRWGAYMATSMRRQRTRLGLVDVRDHGDAPHSRLDRPEGQRDRVHEDQVGSVAQESARRARRPERRGHGRRPVAGVEHALAEHEGGSPTTVAPTRSSRSTSGPVSGSVTSTTAPAPVIAATLSSTTRSDYSSSSAPGCATSTRRPESGSAGPVASDGRAVGSGIERGCGGPLMASPDSSPGTTFGNTQKGVRGVRDEQEAVDRHEDDGCAEEEEGDAQDPVDRVEEEPGGERMPPPPPVGLGACRRSEPGGSR